MNNQLATLQTEKFKMVLISIYGQNYNVIKALKVLNKGFTIGLHVNCLGLVF